MQQRNKFVTAAPGAAATTCSNETAKKKSVLYLSAEWFIGGEPYLISWATNLRTFGHLHDEQLSRHRLMKLIKAADYIFVYGPDLGIIEKHFGIEIRAHNHCINLLKVFRDVLPWWYTSMKLNDLATSFGVGNEATETNENIWEVLRNWQKPQGKATAIADNEDTLEKMIRLKRAIFEKYNITNRDLKNYKMW
jgi:hypothetical protein